MKREVVIIGAGLGGIATAILLAHKGYKVSVFEKNPYAGGRCGNFIKDGHRFDIGATLIMMPDLYKKFYSLAGRSFTNEFELYRMDPTYKIKFQSGEEFLFSADLPRMKDQLESLEAGSYSRFLKYMQKSSKSFKLSMKYFLDRNFYGLFDMINIRNMFLLFQVNAHKNHYYYISKFFKHEVLRYIFTLQNLFIGQNPLTASGVFAGLPYIEISDGVWFPKGGMKEIINNLLAIAKEKGVQVYLNSPVKEIKVTNNSAQGIVLSNNVFHSAEIVLANADLPYVYNQLLPKRLSTKKINKKNYTCSALAFHWGIDTFYPQLEQHNLFVAKNYKKGLHKVFKEKLLAEEQTFYIHSPTRSDKTAAPSGHDTITAIVQVGHIDERIDQNWSTLKNRARKGIIQRLEEEGMKDFKNHIKFEVCYTPKTWQTLFNLSRGAAFGCLSHNLLQMGYFRPHNIHKKYKNLFFVGSSTHPGSGIPMIFISAMLTAERIIQKYK
ncbi:zeta-carotene-forming phytoene desaturase [subsurface metagenome]